jgi:hypothetical protein
MAHKVSRRGRVKAPPRPLTELYSLPALAWVTAPEAASVTGLSEMALATRRSLGQWPAYHRIGRLIRYRLGDLLVPPDNSSLLAYGAAEPNAVRPSPPHDRSNHSTT